MAYVAISGNFMDRVRTKIQYMRNVELKALGEAPIVTCNGNEPFLINAVWGEHAHLMALMPEKWMRQTEDLNVKFAIPGVFTRENEPKYQEINIKLTNALKLPPVFQHYDHKVVPNDEPVLAQAVDYAIKSDEIFTRWKQVAEKITDFLHNCKSANEAVKLWPDIKTYFDKDDVERLEAKAERAGQSASNAAEILKGIDTNQVMSAAVIARLSGAQV